MSEHDHQAAFIEWANWQKIPGIELLHSVPNGGKMSYYAGKRKKDEGMKSGVPDIYWPVPRGGFIGLAIEFKHGDGNPSADQKRWIDGLQKEGWCVAICWSCDAAIRLFRGYSGLLKLETWQKE